MHIIGCIFLCAGIMFITAHINIMSDDMVKVEKVEKVETKIIRADIVTYPSHMNRPDYIYRTTQTDNFTHIEKYEAAIVDGKAKLVLVENSQHYRE